MLQRELRALLADQQESLAYSNLQQGTRGRNWEQLQQTDSMGDQDEEGNLAERLVELERRLEKAEAENRRKDEELRSSYQKLEGAAAEIQSYLNQVDRYAAEIERVKLQGELEKHRALDLLREEHTGQLKFLQTQTERERERTDNWITELKERFERENQGYRERIDALEDELYKQQTHPKPHDPYSCLESECDTNSGLQCPAGSHVNPCPADVLCSVGASGAQTISSERNSLPMLGTMPSRTAVCQITGSGPVYSFSQGQHAPIFKGYVSEPEQPRVTHAHVQFTDAQGHRTD